MSSVKVRYCELCNARGRIIETRESEGVIRRRIQCQRGHRFTTLEIRPEVGQGNRVLTTRIRALA